jgi:hypothetical protein
MVSFITKIKIANRELKAIRPQLIRLFFSILAFVLTVASLIFLFFGFKLTALALTILGVMCVSIVGAITATSAMKTLMRLL